MLKILHRRNQKRIITAMNEKEIIQSMLTSFRDMLRECETKGFKGAKMEDFRSEVNTLETLALSCHSVEEFTTKVQEEDCFTKIGQQYAELLAEGFSQQAITPSTLHHDALLAQHMEAIQKALQSAQQQASSPYNNRLINQLENRMKLAKQSSNYARYLIACIEQGLDDDLLQLSFSEEALKEEMEYYEHYALCPLDFQHKKEIYDMYKIFKQRYEWVDPLLFQQEVGKIDDQYKTKTSAWDTFYKDVYAILDDLHIWATAHCPRAPYVFPWNQIQDELKKRFAIAADKATRHVTIIHKIKLFEADYSIPFLSAFTHPIFEYKARQNDCPYQSSYVLHLLKQVLPCALRKTSLSFSAIQENETLYKQKQLENNCVANYMIGFKNWYSTKHGQEAYEKLYGNIAVPSEAVDWKYDEFKKEIATISSALYEA